MSWRSWACRDFVTLELNALPSLTFCHDYHCLLLLLATKPEICFIRMKCVSPSLLCTWFSGLAFVGLVSLHVCACWSVWCILRFSQIIWRSGNDFPISFFLYWFSVLCRKTDKWFDWNTFGYSYFSMWLCLLVIATNCSPKNNTQQ